MTVHPGAWWIWALLVAAIATTTTNLLLLTLTVVAICLVVACCAQDVAPFRLYLAVAIAVVVIRLAFRLVFPVAGGTALLTLPTVQLGPLELFGTLTTQALVSGLAGGMQLAAIILAVGAAHTLADVLDLLKHAPPALAGLSTALVIAVSVFPGLGRSVVDVGRAARLRGGRRTGLRGLRATVIPVLEGTMDRSLTLAAAMEARGYGSRVVAEEPAGGPGSGSGPGLAPSVPSARLRAWAQPACVLGAVTCVALAAYGLFDSAWPGWAPVALTAVAVAALVGAVGADRAGRRTVYRPQPWTLPSSLVVACAAVAAVMVMLFVPPEVAHPAPVLLPDLTLAALLAPLVLAAPAILAVPAVLAVPAATPADPRPAPRRRP